MTGPVRWRLPVGIALAILLTGVGVLTARHFEQSGVQAAGEAMFEGRTPLVARVGGHADTLPAAAVACANCHVPRPQPVGVALSSVPTGTGGTEGQPSASSSPGPTLHRALLLEPVARRGGPPSRYDRQAFCRVLQSGEDPAGVLLPRVMPRYEIDAATCDALWRFVTR